MSSFSWRNSVTSAEAPAIELRIAARRFESEIDFDFDFHRYFIGARRIWDSSVSSILGKRASIVCGVGMV